MFLGFGEIMARIAPPGLLRWRQALPGAVQVTWGGGEANVCASLALLGPAATFGVFAVLFGLSWIAVAQMQSYPVVPPPEGESIWQSIAEGVRYVVGDQVLVGMRDGDIIDADRRVLAQDSPHAPPQRGGVAHTTVGQTRGLEQRPRQGCRRLPFGRVKVHIA